MQSILTVTVPADSHDLTVLATVKRELGIADGDTSSDSLLTDYIRQISNAIMSYCGRVFALETVSEEFWSERGWGCSDRGAPLVLSRCPVAEIISISVDAADPLDSSLFRLAPDSGLLYRKEAGGRPCSWHFSNSIVVIYSAGYALLDGLPFDLERACIRWVVVSYQERARDPIVKMERIETPGVRTVERQYVGDTAGGTGIPSDIQAMINPYRRISVG